jgi:hypothetical protein
MSAETVAAKIVAEIRMERRFGTKHLSTTHDEVIGRSQPEPVEEAGSGEALNGYRSRSGVVAPKSARLRCTGLLMHCSPPMRGQPPPVPDSGDRDEALQDILAFASVAAIVRVSRRGSRRLQPASRKAA